MHRSRGSADSCCVHTLSEPVIAHFNMAEWINEVAC